jgi:hypothetical protein
MAVLVDLESMGDDELLSLAGLPGESPAVCRLRRQASTTWLQRGKPQQRHGRWPLLVWFTKQERILSSAELADALSRQIGDD